MNLIVLSVDGLHNGMIGAFGNAWIQTPALDALAFESVLFDRYYTNSMDLASIFSSFWRHESASMPSQLAEKGLETILLTDDEDVFLHENAADFRQRQRLESVRTDKPVESLEETQFFKALASTVDLARQEAEKKKPYFLWTHLQGFRGLWDFPLDYREKHRDDEEDPEAYAGVQIPEIVCQDGEEIHPDDLQAVMEAYAGGISVLDDALAGLIDALEEGELGGETVLVFVSTRGFSLGEHRRIGANDDLYGENVQLPMMIRFPNGLGQTVRCPALLQPSDFAELCSKFPLDVENKTTVLLKLIREELDSIRDSLRIKNTKGEKAIVTDNWFLRKEKALTLFQYRLYAKPDDHWEVNDVADRCSDEVESLSKLLDCQNG